MSKISVNKREMNTSFSYEGEKYNINGNSMADYGGAVTSINMNINGKDGSYVGNANAYVNGGESKPKINISSVDTDILGDVVAEIQACITAVNAEQTATESN